MSRGTEEEALFYVDGFLKKLCQSKWKEIEYEDRLSELRLLFLCAWRKLPTNTGHFLEDFETLCQRHMKEIAGRYGSRHFGPLSLDAPLICQNGAQHFTLSDILSAPEEDETVHDVEAFLNGLNETERYILEGRLENVTKHAISRELQLPICEINRILLALGYRYLHEYHHS